MNFTGSFSTYSGTNNTAALSETSQFSRGNAVDTTANSRVDYAAVQVRPPLGQIFPR